MSEKAAVWYKEADDQPALTGDIVIHLRVNIFDVSDVHSRGGFVLFG
jgi:hypothetical protein